MGYQTLEKREEPPNRSPLRPASRGVPEPLEQRMPDGLRSLTGPGSVVPRTSLAMTAEHDPHSSAPSRGKGARRAAAPPLSWYAGHGVQFVVVVVLFMFAGRWLDGELGTTPLFLVVGVLLGCVGSTISLVRAVDPPKAQRPPESSTRDDDRA